METPYVAIVTGMAGLGKSTFGAALAAAHGVPLVCGDAFRYLPGTWTKTSSDAFAAAVRGRLADAMASDPRGFVFESSYLDVNDPEDARGHVIRELLQSHATAQLFVLRGALADVFTGVIDRCRRRYAKELPEGAAPETAANVAQLLLKLSRGFAQVEAALDALQSANPHACVGKLPDLAAAAGVSLPF